MTRDENIATFEARLSQQELFILHNGLMLDYDLLPDAALAALAEGVRWMTFEITEVDDPQTFGNVNFSCDKHATMADGEEIVTDSEWAEELAYLLKLPRGVDLEGVLVWGVLQDEDSPVLWRSS